MINAERMGCRCERSVGKYVGTLPWLARTHNRKCNVFPKSDRHQKYTRYRYRRNADLLKISACWLTEFSRNSQTFRTDSSILVVPCIDNCYYVFNGCLNYIITYHMLLGEHFSSRFKHQVTAPRVTRLGLKI